MVDAMRRSLLSALAVLALSAPAPASADDEVRVGGTCGKGATSELRLRAKDGAIQVRFEVDSRRAYKRWEVVLVHERRVVWRGRVRTRSGGSFRVRRSVPDFTGADQVSARASGPRGNTCAAAAVLTGP